MRWFEEHLNWAWVIGQIAAAIGGFALASVLALNGVSQDTASLAVNLMLLMVGLPISAWVLHRKDRSLWWLLLNGIGSPLWLANYAVRARAEDAHPRA